MTYTEFLIYSTAHFGNNRRTLRFGQAVFNCLYSVRPEIADELRGTPLDPFYKTSVGPEVWQFISDRW